MCLLFCSKKKRSHGIGGTALVGVQCGSRRRFFVFLWVWIATPHLEFFFLLHSLGPCHLCPTSPIASHCPHPVLSWGYPQVSEHRLRISTIDAEVGCWWKYLKCSEWGDLSEYDCLQGVGHCRWPQRSSWPIEFTGQISSELFRPSFSTKLMLWSGTDWNVGIHSP